MKLPMEKLCSRPAPYIRGASPRRAASDLPAAVRTHVRARHTARHRPQLRPLDFSSVRKGATAEVAAFISPSSDAGLSGGGFETPVALRRASTLTLPSDDSSETPVQRSHVNRYDSVTDARGSRSSSIKTTSSSSTDSLSRSPSCNKVTKDKSSSAKNSFSNVSSLLKSLTIPRRLSSYRTDSTRSIPAENSDENNLVEEIGELRQMQSRSKSSESSKSSVSRKGSVKSTCSSSGRRPSKLSVESENVSTETDTDISDVCVETTTEEAFEKSGERETSLSRLKCDPSLDQQRGIEANSKLLDDDRMVDNDYECPIKVDTSNCHLEPKCEHTTSEDSEKSEKPRKIMKRSSINTRRSKGGKTRVVPRGVNKAAVLSWKKRKEAVAILKREKIADSYMNKTSTDKSKPDSFKWTGWSLAISPAAPRTKRSKFIKCSHYPGYRIKTIFDKDSQKPALYEFAVQCPGSSRKHVVYHKSSAVGYKTVIMWDLYHLRHKSIRAEVQQVVAAGCSIWIRRGTLRCGPRCSRDEEERRVRRAEVWAKTRIDYAWKKYLWRRSGNRMFHREVVVRRTGAAPIVISHADL